MVDEKICQEFYCNDCDGYFRVKLNINLNISVFVVCPNCRREHPRKIKDGKILEGIGEAYAERVFSPKSTYSNKPFTIKAKKHIRNGAVIDSVQCIRDQAMRELWLERFR